MKKKTKWQEQKSKWKCCNKNASADTGRYSSGMHNHAPGSNLGRVLSKSTGTDSSGKPAYIPSDPSAKKNQTKLMKALGVID